MKSIFFSLCILLATTLQAQISGKVSDTTGQPLSGATVSLLHAEDSAYIKLAVSDEKGSWSLPEQPSGRYLIKASYTGYADLYSSVISLKDGEAKNISLQLTPMITELAAAVITARKPLVEVMADKMILNVEGTVQSTGTDALELLRKSPGVFIDKDDRISMNGKNGVRIYIDGKPSPLSGQDLSSYLKSLQSAQVSAIELISNPSARYDAAGNAGIINIRLKKNLSHGLNGSVNLGYNIGTYGKYNGGLSLNYRNSIVNVFGNYNPDRSRIKSDLFIDRDLTDSIFNTKSKNIALSRTHNFKAGADFFLNKQNILGVMVSGNLADMDLNSRSLTALSYPNKNDESQLSNTENRSTTSRDNMAYNINYQYSDAKGKSLTVNADRATYETAGLQFQHSIMHTGASPFILDYEIQSPGKIDINSAKADWEQNLAKGRLSAGVKSSFVKSDNDFRQYIVTNQIPEQDNLASNRFFYREEIHATYVSFSRQFKGLALQAGIRAENTVSNGISHAYNGQPDQTFRKNYLNIFPSATLSLNKNPMKQMSVSYSRRIDRPSYQQLNPFEYRMDEYTIVKGNMHLQPQYTNNFALTYVYKFKLSASLNYSHVNHMMAQLTDTLAGNKLVITTGNLVSQDVVGVNISYPYRYKKLTVFGNINSNYSRYRVNEIKEGKKQLDAFALSAVMQGSLAFADNWTAQMTAFYNAPTVFQGSFRARSLWAVDAGIQHQFSDKRMSIKASVSDVFNSLRFRGNTVFAGQQTGIRSNWESRQFKLSLNYRFGRNEIKPARQRKTGVEEEGNRLKGGGGGISIGQ